MSEFYRKYIGKDLEQLVIKGNYKKIRDLILLDLFACATFGFFLGIFVVRAGWIS